jgi:hypothetical protein
MRHVPFVASLLCAVALAGGCRGEMPRLQDDPDLAALKTKVKPGSERAKLALAPIETAYAPTADLDKDSSRYPAKVNREETREGMKAAITKYGPFAAPGVLGGTDLPGTFAQAFEGRYDVLVRPVYTKLDCTWRGRNGYFVPNVLLWVYAWVPSFWVPDEDYGLDGELALEFYSVASERLLYTKKVPIEDKWPLDDFERGWSLTGIITAPKTVDIDDWGMVADTLAPLARYHSEKGAALEVATKLPGYLKSKEYAEKEATVFALVCGVSRHKSAVAGAAGAANDAEKFAAFLAGEGRVPAKNIRMLADQRATAHAIEQGFSEHLGRSRAADTVLVYWSGIGAVTKGSSGEPERCLLPYDTDEDLARTGISLTRLRELVSKVPAQNVVVILDSSFGGRRPGSRSLTRDPGSETALGEVALERWTEGRDGKQVTLYVASAPGEDAVDLEGANRGLLSYLLEEGAAGAADDDRNGLVTAAELGAHIQREVPAQAGLDGASQHPRVYRDGKLATNDESARRNIWLRNMNVKAPAAASPAPKPTTGKGKG